MIPSLQPALAPGGASFYARPMGTQSNVDPAALAARFETRFGARPRIARAPGRINLIGEHTDYNGGLVLPAAIDRACYVAAAPAAGDRFGLIARDVDAEGEFRLDEIGAAPDWARYLAAPALILTREGTPPPSANLMAAGDVPIGMGMSSSAALMVASTLALLDLRGERRAPMDVALIAQRAECDVVGMPCGLMDQFASTHGARGAALLLDCRDLSWRTVKAPADAAFIVFESGVRHALSDGGYAARRAECARAATALDVAFLSDAKPADLDVALRDDPVALRRARHVLSENARVREAAGALERGDLESLGLLMNASHASLRDDFAVTCAETDALAALAQSTDGVFGARQMGGGFGGGVLALVECQRAAQVASAVTARTGLPAIVCAPADGAGMLA